MKNVFSNAKLAEMWYSQSQHEGKNSNGSFSFNGRELISYNTAIAYLISPKIIITTSRIHSVTTQKQITLARRASGYTGVQFIEMDLGDRGTRNWTIEKLLISVPNAITELHKKRMYSLDKAGRARTESSKKFHRDNVDNYRKQISWLISFDVAYSAAKV